MQAETLDYQGKVFRFPYRNKFRDLNDDELIELRESIKEDGIQYPIFLDNFCNVIDGRHRLVIAIELEIPIADIPVCDMTDATEEAKERLAIKLNRARRHLSQEEIQQLAKERRERVAEARKRGKSTRAIAEKEGVSQKTILNDIEKSSTDDPSSVEPEDGKVTGKDGKKRSSTGKKKSSAPKTEPASDSPANQDPPQFTFDPPQEQSREPGSDNQGLQGLEKPPKNGSVVFDWSDWNTHFGKLNRQIDNLYKACGLVNKYNAVERDDDYREVNDLLSSYYEKFRELYTKKTGKQPPR